MIWSNWWFQPLRWEIRYLAITRDAHARKRVMISIFAHHTFILAVTTLWLWLHTHYIVLDTSYNWPVTTVLHESHKKHQHPVLSRRSETTPEEHKIYNLEHVKTVISSPNKYCRLTFISKNITNRIYTVWTSCPHSYPPISFKTIKRNARFSSDTKNLDSLKGIKNLWE